MISWISDLLLLFFALLIFTNFYLNTDDENQTKLLSQVDVMEEIEAQEAEMEIQNEIEIAYYLDTINKELDIMKK
ncbi:hypothetical protein BpHYR1_010135 [Brachionus plicatilis]|uniref:Uncharacterized protein n=1 Tax=Brachionus plicatilis TaxID=10195 RepID=A0A3M7R9D1_BRAPC|nr:hypothetical protein BpHYR1_010135 [Brachionus plicatilis]